MISPVQRQNFINYPWFLNPTDKVQKKPVAKDTFELNSKFINTVNVFEKHSPIKTPVGAQIYKYEGKNFSKYYLKRNDEILGTMDLQTRGADTFISNLEAFKRKRYKGIGTTLLQLAVEESLGRGKNATVTLNAQSLHFIQRHPEGFYKKMGFDTLKATNEEISTYGIPMILYSKKSGFWKERIEKNKLL